MRFTPITLLVVANNLRAAAADTDIPDCALPAFKNALEKAGCDANEISAATIGCTCKQLAGISESMALSVAASKLDANCLKKWGSAVQTLCTYWDAASSSTTDLSEATKALDSELGRSTSGALSTVSSASVAPTASSSNAAGPTPTASPSKTAATSPSKGVSTSPSKAPGGIATPAAVVIGAAALAGLLA